MWSGVGEVQQRCQFVVDLTRRSDRLIPQPYVQRQIWPRSPIIVEVQGQKGLAEALFQSDVTPVAETLGNVGKKILQRAEVENPARGIGRLVVLNALYGPPEFDGMLAVRPKSIVVGLDVVEGLQG